jgi:hypothetical protein
MNAALEGDDLDELRLVCPGMPIGAKKQMEITSRAGSTLNVPRALQILKEKSAPLAKSSARLCRVF